MIRRIIIFCYKYWLLKKDPTSYARSIGVRIGADTRVLGIQLGTFGSEPYLVQLGDHVEVTSGVKFITHDGGVWLGRKEFPDIDILAPIKVGNNVFIGIDSIIMPGVTIGDNVVIGAGSVVTRDIPSGSVVAGSPAKHINSASAYLKKARGRSLNTRSMPPEEKKKLVPR